MANPTTAKPTGNFAEWDSTAGTIGAAMRCFIAPLANGSVRDVVGNVVAEPFAGTYTAQPAFAHPPATVANAFTFGGLSDSVIRFKCGTMPLKVTGRGFSGGQAYPRTFFAVFKPLSAPRDVAVNVGVVTTDSVGWPQGLGYQIGTNGSITIGDVLGISFGNSGITLTSGKTYAVAMTYTSATGRLMQVYCYDDQAYVTTQATGTTYTGPSLNNTTNSDCVIGSCYTGYPFYGDIYCGGLHDGTFDPATNTFFDDFMRDPYKPARGTYAGGGALTAGGIVGWDETTSVIVVVSNRPAGGTPASYQFALHRSTTPGFTPSAGTRVVPLQSSPVLTDATAVAGTTYHYKVEQTDGTNTVYSTTASTNRQQVGRRLSKGDFLFGITGDSRWTGAYVDVTRVAAFFRSQGFRVGYVNRSKGATFLTNIGAGWQPNTTQDPVHGTAGTTLLANALSEFSQAGVTHIICGLGINDSSAVSASTFQTQYGYFANYVTSQGYKLVLEYPYLSSQTTYSAVVTYQPAIDATVNGTTVLGPCRSAFAISGRLIESDSADGLHIKDDEIVLATAKDILDLVLAPVTSSAGGGGGGRMGIGL
jgi:hypothetical protein